MRLWYLLTTSILCVLLFCEAQNSKGLNSKPKASQLLRFFKLNNDISKKEDNRSDHSQEVITKENEENFHSRPPKCKLPKNCTEDAKSSTVKKSFRPHDYDYDDEDDDEDYDDFRSSNDYPEDDEFPEEDTIGSYRAFEDSPPRPRDPGPSAEDYEDDHESDYEFEDEPRDRPRYEDDLDQERDRWDWESPLRHHERARWRWHHPSYDANDGYERDFPPRFRHLPRRVHHRIHRNHHRHPAIQASYRTMEQAGPVSWPPISQGYRSITSSALGWTNGPATQTNLQSSPYLSPTTMQPVDSIGPRIINPYVQDAPSSPQAEINPFLVPRYPEQLPSALNLESTAQNFPGFSRTFPATTMSFPRVFHDTFHSPRLTPLMASRMTPFRRQLSRIFLRHGRFPYTIFNRIARRDETQ